MVTLPSLVRDAFNWLWDNKHWLFSGIGVLALAALLSRLRQRRDPYSLRPSLLETLSQRRARRRHRRVLSDEWPLFQAKLKTFSLLVAEAHPRSARVLLSKLSSHTSQGEQVTTRNERAVVEGVVRYVNYGLRCVTEEAKRVPRNLREAGRVVHWFEFLVGGLNFTQASTALRAMPPDGTAHADATKKWFDDFEQFLREYRAFADDMNAKLRERLFGATAFIPE